MRNGYFGVWLPLTKSGDFDSMKAKVLAGILYQGILTDAADFARQIMLTDILPEAAAL